MTLPNSVGDEKKPVVWEFDWSDIPQAKHYYLNVYDNSNPRIMIIKRQVTKSFYQHQLIEKIADKDRTGWR